MIKRAFDVCAAGVGLLVISPVLVIIAVLIKLDSPGPVFFSQVRVGKGFRPFRIHKFRTMVDQSPDVRVPLTVGQDTAITRVGRVLRRFKLDELPQLANVLVGDMSVVGPRPEVPRYVEHLRSDFAKVLAVRPGLTDLASLKYINEATLLGLSSNPEQEYLTSVLPEKLRLAKLYIRHMSFQLDLALIVQTLLRLLGLPAVVCKLPELKSTQRTAAASPWDIVSSLVLTWRRPLIIVLDLSLIMLANYLAFALRFDGEIPGEQLALFWQTAPWLVVIRGIAFGLFGLNEGLWRYISVWDLNRIVSGVIGSALVFYAFISWVMGFADYPRSVFIIDAIVLVGFLVGVRLPSRVLNEAAIFRKNKRVLVVGAGDPGERVVREMKTRSEFHCTPIGLVGEHVGLLNQRIHGVKVLGTLGDLPKLVEELKPEMVVVAVPNPTPVFLRDLIAKLEPYEVSLKTLPGQDELMVDRSTVSQIRNISIPDLLPRGQVNLVTDAMRQMVKGKGVMITGAGGSIGSELARQVSLLEPRVLLLYERHENSLYHIHKELEDSGFAFPIIPVIGDVTDAQRLCMALEQNRPQILFHAAAHKHVPLVELNPVEAVKNNCLGTRITAESASLYGVEQFVHISTDKAVNPSSVMGATKRVAELIIQNIARTSQTRFILVRFGNVLGSSGSVVLRFQEQIRSGGPVTVTHPEICRFFMLIPEAVQLVLQAATIGEQGQIYILDMGEQVKVLDLARNLIRLCGFVPDRDIPIRFVGLRPGEKLYEELVGEGEVAVCSPSEKILKVCTTRLLNFEEFRRKLSALEAESFRGEAHAVLERLKEIVPMFQSPTTVEPSLTPVYHGAGMK